MTSHSLIAGFTLALISVAQSDRGADVRDLVQPLIDGGAVPGVVVGIFENGKPAVFAFGKRSADDPTTPNGQTLYEIGSISKVFTGTLLADAIERDLVKADDPLSKYLPPGVEAPRRNGEEILLWHLATHTSGLPRLPNNIKALQSDNPYKAYDANSLWAYINGATLLTEPGKTYAYSNLGAGLLGTVLANASGSTYEKLMKDRIARPLGMTNTTLTLTPEQKKNLAPPHDGSRVVSTWEFDALAGCGAIRSNVDDMLKFVEATLAQGKEDAERAITISTRRRFTLPNAPAGIGLGWHIAQDGSTLWHNGQTGGYHAAMFVNRMLNCGVVVLSNGNDQSVSVVAERIIQMLAGVAVAPPKVRSSIELTPAQLAPLVGVYPSSIGFTIYITSEGDKLMAQLTNQQSLRIWPESPTRFFYKEVDAEIQFEIDDKTGQATALTLLQNGQEMRCARKSE